MTAAFGGSPNPGDTGNESINNFNKRENVPATEQTGIDLGEDSGSVGPPDNPSTGFYPDPYWRRSPLGDPDNRGIQLVEKGWLPTEIVPAEQQDEE